MKYIISYYFEADRTNIANENKTYKLDGGCRIAPHQCSLH